VSARDPLRAYEEASSWQKAERALDALAAAGPPADIPIGDLYDEVATHCSEEGDHELAVRAQRKALEHGCSHRDLGREMLGRYLLKAGRAEEGEAQFARLRAERGVDPELELTHARALADAGRGGVALEAFDRALEAARLVGDDAAIAEARAERRACRRRLGLNEDEDDRLAPRSALGLEDGVEPFLEGEEVLVAIAWFPRDEHAEALACWPDLDEDLHDPDAYCRRIEGLVRDASRTVGRRARIAPLRPKGLIEFAEGQGLDPDSGTARSRYAAELGRRGETIAWPPARNEPCWCGSGSKYKRCCGS
jgi:tetratricopeptide (TPR) repeat protein